MSGFNSAGPVMPRCRQSLVIPTWMCESHPSWIDTTDGDSISGVAQDGTLIPVAVYAAREESRRRRQARAEFERRLANGEVQERTWLMAATRSRRGAPPANSLISPSMENMVERFETRYQAARRQSRDDMRREAIKCWLEAVRQKPVSWLFEILAWLDMHYWLVVIRLGDDVLPKPELDKGIMKHFIQLLAFVAYHAEQDQRKEARRDGWRQLRSKIGLGSETTSSSGTAKNSTNGFRPLRWRRSSTKTPPGSPSDPSEEELDEPIVPAVIRIEDGPAPLVAEEKQKWWKQLKLTKS
ncbi:hypothetical protein HDU96_004933, partial [Phlyctochytrium bullatum]